ncbi:MAG: aminomethyltransferase family protein [Longimicrobiales bacterium]|nr:aminomethyltransferase family protein [Longimicrobiales bacterium]
MEPLNRTGIWKHWAGYLVPPQYQLSLSNEYWAIRNAVALLDTSPLFKYRFAGPDARRVLERILARNIGACAPGRAQYTCWCDQRGFILQDGVVLHVPEGEYWLTAAEPSLRYFRNVARAMEADVSIDDISHDYGILALQGPHAHHVLRQLTDDATPLRFFGVCRTEFAGCGVVVSRTGYTGDLGYEIWVENADAETVWDALFEAGRGHNLTPIGTTALKMARIEAGLLLMGADFQMSRLAWVDGERDTPLELGWSWMFRKLAEDQRDFIGRSAIEAELADGSSRWRTVGLAVDWHDYERVYAEAGLLPPRHEIYAETTMSVYRRGDIEWDYAGWATSFTTSSLLRQPLAIAKLPLDLSEPGTEVDLELSVLHRPTTVLARVHRMPFFDPPRKTASMEPAAMAEASVAGGSD